MESKKLKWSVCLLFILSLGFTSCSDDDDKIEPDVFESVAIKNAELKAVLQDKGYKFNELGELVQNDSVLNLTTLDLSGCELTDVSGLEVFPKLTEVNLSDNNFGNEFDFSVLPSTIKGVDLTKNKIFYYNGLVTVVYAENGEPTVTVKYNLTKLHLPNSAKYDVESILLFFLNDKSIDMKMENKQGALEAYTTIREVPDAILLGELKKMIPSLFVGDDIDISKHLSLEETLTNVYFSSYSIAGITDFTGIEYIIRHPEWKGSTFGIESYAPELPYEIPYIKIPSSVTGFILSDISAPYGIDFSTGKNLSLFLLINLRGIEKVDLSMSKWGQTEGFDVMSTKTNLMLVNCPSLKEVLLPEKKNLVTAFVRLEKLPSLEKFDFSNFAKIDLLLLGILPESCNLIYPNLTHFQIGSPSRPKHYSRFACTNEVFARQETKDFLNKYYWNLEDGKRKIESNNHFMTEEGNREACDWEDSPPAGKE